VAPAMLRGAMSTRPITCLIVDDSPPFLEAARQLLTDDGVAVVGFAATSAEAVERAMALRPDVVLVDVDLGAESGLDVARRLGRLRGGGPPGGVVRGGGGGAHGGGASRAEPGSELAELVGASGALGFVSKTDLSGDAIRQLLAGPMLGA